MTNEHKFPFALFLKIGLGHDIPLEMCWQMTPQELIALGEGQAASNRAFTKQELDKLMSVFPD